MEDACNGINDQAIKDERSVLTIIISLWTVALCVTKPFDGEAASLFEPETIAIAKRHRKMQPSV